MSESPSESPPPTGLDSKMHPACSAQSVRITYSKVSIGVPRFTDGLEQLEKI